MDFENFVKNQCVRTHCKECVRIHHSKYVLSVFSYARFALSRFRHTENPMRMNLSSNNKPMRIERGVCA